MRHRGAAARPRTAASTKDTLRHALEKLFKAPCRSRGPLKSGHTPTKGSNTGNTVENHTAHTTKQSHTSTHNHTQLNTRAPPGDIARRPNSSTPLAERPQPERKGTEATQRPGKGYAEEAGEGNRHTQGTRISGPEKLTWSRTMAETLRPASARVPAKILLSLDCARGETRGYRGST